MKYEQLATDLLFGSVKVVDIGPKYGLQFRKGKDATHIIKARQKATKTGHGKVEFELSMLEVYLKEILKKA
jgi:hypothetical protein